MTRPIAYGGPFQKGGDPWVKPREKSEAARKRESAKRAHARLVSSILKYARLNGFYAREIRVQSIRLPNGTYVPSSTKGVLDVYVQLPGGMAAWFDAKTGSGRLTAEQVQFCEAVRALGGIAEAVRSIDDVRAVLLKAGVKLREVE